MSDTPPARPQTSPPRDYGSTIGRTLDLTQAAIYLIAAVFLVLLAVLTFVFIAEQFGSLATKPLDIGFVDAVLENILIVFIITGLIQTLIVYIKSHTLDPWLVLVVGLTAVVRRILVFGATPKPWQEELLTAALLLVIIIGMYLVSKLHRSPIEAER